MGFFDKLNAYMKGPAASAPAQAAPAAPEATSATIPQSYIERVAMIESSNNPNARAKTSTATGLFQITDATWASLRQQAPDLRLTADGRTDRAQATRAFVWLTEQSDRIFAGRIGRNPTNPERYLCHFLGPVRAVQVCGSVPSDSLERVWGPAYAAIARANPFLAGWTASQLKAWAEKKVGTA